VHHHHPLPTIQQQYDCHSANAIGQFTAAATLVTTVYCLSLPTPTPQPAVVIVVVVVIMALEKWAAEWRVILDGQSQRWREEDQAALAYKHNLAFIVEHAGRSDFSHVLVPLCGDSPIMTLLWEHGYHVTGVEIFPTAVERLMALFDGKVDFSKTPLDAEAATLYRSSDNKVEIYQGDFFSFSEHYGRDKRFGLIYDRGALTAIEPHQRARYTDGELHMLRRPDGLFFLDCVDLSSHPPADASKPPYDTTADDMDRLFLGHSRPLQIVATDRTELSRYIKQRFLMSFKA
jgi:hypothetical protein